MVVVTFRFTEDFFAEANRRMRSLSRRHLALWACAPLLALPAFVMWRDGYEWWRVLLLSVALAGVGLLAYAALSWLNQRELRRFFHQDPERDQLIRMEFRDDGFHTKSDIASSSVDWQVFTKVIHFRDGILLFEGPLAAHWIPVRYLEDAAALADLETLLHEKIADHRIIESAIWKKSQSSWD